MKTDFLKIFALSLIIGTFPFQSHGVTEAGEFRHEEQKKSSAPSVDLYFSNNMTSLEVPTAKDLKKKNSNVESVDFSAEQIISDEEKSTITAQGNVEIKYADMRMTADKLIYDQTTDKIMAVGNVKLYSRDGSLITGDFVSLSENMSTGEMRNIKAYLRDKSFVSAERFRKKDNQTKTMSRASYTACDICEGKKPLWEIKARKVQHDEKSQDVNYNDAFLYIKGLPVFYTPFLTHPDPYVKRRSGLLAPDFGSSNYLGEYLHPRFFWAVNDQTDIIFSPIFSSDRNPVWEATYQHYFYNSHFYITGSYMKNNDDKRPRDRGHVFAKGRYDINDNWRMTYNLKYVSDYIYLKDLDLPFDDDAWLTSEVNLERFSGRDYISVEAYYYKLLSYNLHNRNNEQYRVLNSRKPLVAPLIDAEFYTEPNSFGAYFKNQINAASVYHNNGMDTQRLTAINSWELPYTSQFGEKYRITASLKSDAYYIHKYQYGNKNTYSGAVGRVFPQLGMEWRLPFIRATDNSRQIIEPVVVGVLAPNGGNKATKIPNEDSEDVYFDDTNILDLDRYAGYDRNDTGSRISYGINWNSYGNIFGKTSAFIAQSFQQKTDSGFMQYLNNKKKSHFSDLVGRINSNPNEYLALMYRFRVDKRKFDAKYNELYVSVGPRFLKFNASYIFLQGNTHYNNLYSQRKELYTSIRADITQNWSVTLYNLRDLTPKSVGTLEHGGSVIYEDECFKWETTFKKYNTNNPNLDNDYEFGVTFFLKTIGSFGS